MAGRLYTISESAQYLGCSPSSLLSRPWRERMRLPAIRVGRALMFDETDLDRVRESRQDQFADVNDPAC